MSWLVDFSASEAPRIILTFLEASVAVSTVTMTRMFPAQTRSARGRIVIRRSQEAATTV